LFHYYGTSLTPLKTEKEEESSITMTHRDRHLIPSLELLLSAI